MLIQDAIRLMREICALRHLSINTEKTYIYWLARVGVSVVEEEARLKEIEDEVLDQLHTVGEELSAWKNGLKEREP